MVLEWISSEIFLGKEGPKKDLQGRSHLCSVVFSVSSTGPPCLKVENFSSRCVYSISSPDSHPSGLTTNEHSSRHFLLLQYVFPVLFYLFIYLFFWCSRSLLLCEGFLSAVSGGYSLVGGRTLLVVVASLIVEHGL